MILFFPFIVKYEPQGQDRGRSYQSDQGKEKHRFLRHLRTLLSRQTQKGVFEHIAKI